MTACSPLQDLTDSLLMSQNPYEENSENSTLPRFLHYHKHLSLLWRLGLLLDYFFTFTFVRQNKSKAVIQSMCLSITFDYTIIFVQNPPPHLVSLMHSVKFIFQCSEIGQFIKPLKYSGKVQY